MKLEDLIEIPDNEVVLTTMDNPFNPKVDYYKWRNWDISNGYNTEELLAKVANIPDEVDDEVTITKLTLEAMLSILEDDFMNIYKLV